MKRASRFWAGSAMAVLSLYLAASLPLAGHAGEAGKGKQRGKGQEEGKARSEQLLAEAKKVFAKLPEKMPGAEKDTKAKVELGEKLYFEKAMSINNTQSCNSCHRVAENLGGAAGRPEASTCTALTPIHNWPAHWAAAPGPTISSPAHPPSIAAAWSWTHSAAWGPRMHLACPLRKAQATTSAPPNIGLSPIRPPPASSGFTARRIAAGGWSSSARAV